MYNKKVHYVNKIGLIGYRTICGRILSFQAKNCTSLEHEITCLNCLNLYQYKYNKSTEEAQTWYKRLFRVIFR